MAASLAVSQNDDGAMQVFHRVNEASSSSSPNHLSSNRKRRKIMDAVVLEEGEDSAAAATQPKRRKLTLQIRPETTTTAYPVLTPEQNRVNESLLAVFQGRVELRDHLHEFPAQYLDWCTDAGTWLHAAALFNATELVAQYLPRSMQGSDGFLDMMDDEARTAIDVARLSCNGDVLQVLEAYHDDSEYVYDLYEASSVIAAVRQSDCSVLECEVLMGEEQVQQELVPSFGATGDDADSVHDSDSNDENWGGNDYPETEDDSSDAEDSVGEYRHRSMPDEAVYDAAYGDIYGQFGQLNYSGSSD